jgi:folate-dependent phosphoribosylglycinamide formyltransferase PurN
VLARAAKAGVPARYIAVAGRTKDVYDAEVTAAFADAGVSLVLLVGYMRILSSQVRQAVCHCAEPFNFIPCINTMFSNASSRRTHTDTTLQFSECERFMCICYCLIST